MNNILQIINDLIKKIKLPFLTPIGMAFDLGSQTTRIALEERGVVLRQPSLIGYHSKIKEFLFFGKEAQVILGKTPDYLKIIEPIVHGVVNDFDAEVSLVKKFIDSGVSPYFKNFLIKPPMYVLTAVPFSATEIEQRAAEEIFYKLGIHDVFVLEKPLVNALGCGIDVFAHRPALIIDLGAGLVEMAIVSGGGIVGCRTFKNGGKSMNKNLANYLYLKYGILIGDQASEQLKKELLTLDDNLNKETMSITGKSIETGLPKIIKVKSLEVREALTSSFYQIADLAKELIETAPPEIIDELVNQGVYLTGGLSRIPGINAFFEKELKLPINFSQHYEETTIYGLIYLFSNKEAINKLAIRI